MAMVNSGTSIVDSLIPRLQTDESVTMPLFIGYRIPCKSSHTVINPMEPFPIASSWEITTYFCNDSDNDPLVYALHHFFDNGGTCCYVLPLSLEEKIQRETKDKLKLKLTALVNALTSPELAAAINADMNTGLLLVPELRELNNVIPGLSGADKEDLWYRSWQALLQQSCSYPPRFALLELPDDPKLAKTLTASSFAPDLCKNGAAWWPGLVTTYRSKAGNNDLTLSPLPAVAAAIQVNAYQRGVWTAPANIPLAKTRRPSQNALNFYQLFNQQGVYCNPIRNFRDKGVRLWGCRTLLNDDKSPWRYIQTRLLINSVAVYLSKLARTFLFEPNNAQTWMKLKGQCWTWLRQQWLAGAFYGATEEEAFTLSMGVNDSLSAEDIATGKMTICVRLALLAPAEFIAINLLLDMHNSTLAVQDGR